MLSSILAVTIAATTQSHLSDFDIATLRSLKNWGLLEGPDKRNNYPNRHEVALAINVTTHHLGLLVDRMEQRLARFPSGSNIDRVSEGILSYVGWRDVFPNFRTLTVTYREELTKIDVDVADLLASQSEYARRFLVLSARANGPFRDVPNDHWAFQAVDELRLAGILVGYPDMSFQGSPPK